MTTTEALAALGAKPELLTDEERTQIDEQGFVYLHDVLSSEQVSKIRARLDELLKEEGDRAGLEVHQEKGTARLANLVEKDPLFEVFFTHPRVLAAISYILDGDLQLSALNSRAALPGEGYQNLHADGAYDAETREFESCQTSWLIDELTPLNGPTRVIPGSHRQPTHPREVLEDMYVPHPDEIFVVAPAGTVVVMPASLWHSGTTNRTAKPRRVVHGYFSRRTSPQMTVQRESLSDDTRRRLSPAALHILNAE